MNIFDYDLDRFAKALNIQGFDLVLLLDQSGTVLAEKSIFDIASDVISEHVSSITQLSNSLAEQIEGGPLQAAHFEFGETRIMLGATPSFILCGVPSAGTPLIYAKNEIGHALQALV